MQKICLPAVLIAVFYSTQLTAQPEGKKYVQLLQDVFQTELVYPQEKNEFQFTLLPSYHRYSASQHYQLPFIAEYGITDKWQLEFEWNLFQYSKLNPGSFVSGTGGLEIGTKYSFMNVVNSDFHAAVGFEVGIPPGSETSTIGPNINRNENPGYAGSVRPLKNKLFPDENEELGEGLWEYEPYLLLAADLPGFHNVQLFGQAGYSFVQQKETDEPEGNELNLGGGFFMPVMPVIFSSEITWYHSDDTDQLLYTPGAVLTLKNGWETGVAFPLGLNRQTFNFGIMAMITFEFNIERDND